MSLGADRYHIDPLRLGQSGARGATTFLRGDDTWATGPVGAQGAQGATGSNGAQGAQGATGTAGTGVAGCRVATAAVLSGTPTYANGASGVGATLTEVGFGVLTVDGVAVALNDRILVKNQAAPEQNGIYAITTVGTSLISYILTRTPDYDQNTEIFEGTYTLVAEGTVNTATAWIETTSGTLTIGTSAIAFEELGISGDTAGGDLTGTYPNPTIKSGVGLTGVPTAPTAAVDTNTTQLATTAMVLAQAAAATPLADGVAAVGTSTRYARADHVHPVGDVDLTADQSVISSTTLVTITGMTFAIGANERWNFRGVFAAGIALTDGAGGGPGIKFGITTPTSPTFLEFMTALRPGSSTTPGPDTATYWSLLKTTTAAHVYGDTAGSLSVPAADAIVDLFLTITNGASAGNVVFQFAQGVNKAVNTTLKRGGYIHPTRMA